MMQWLSRPVVSEVKMLRIGEFSRLSQVTIKALRYYDDMGLLKPAYIDPFTSYRYYSVEQLPRIHRIIAFKELGLSLEQIVTLLDDNLSSEPIRDTLRLQHAEIKQRISEEQARLAQVEFRLRMIDMEDQMPNIEVIIKPVPPVRALTLRTSISQEAIRAELLAFQTEVEAAVTQHQIKFTSPWTEIHYTEEYQLDYQDVEFVFPVDETQTEDVPLATAGTLRLRTLPSLPMAATYMHHGKSTTQLSDVLAVLQRWIVDNDYRLRGTHRIVHHRGAFERAEYADWILEFQHEIEPVE
jgi:DNA-binding transcriptional MerR regulator